MLNIQSALEHLDIDNTSTIRAVQDVRKIIEVSDDHCGNAKKLLHKLFDIEVPFSDEHAALFTAQAMVEAAVKTKGEVADVDVLLQQALARAAKLRANPKYQFCFAKAETTAAPTETVQVVKEVDTKVAVKANGKIKKGGKQILAAELYKKFVLEAAKPLDNQGFIKLLEKKLDMSKAGATTYAYNCKKQFAAK